MLLQYFGFREDPFGVTPDSRFLYESSTHCEALASLKYGFLSSRGFIALVAGPGMGKTTILTRFLQEIRGSARTAFLFDVDPNCTPSDLISYILRDIGLVPGKNSAEMHEQLKVEVANEAQAGRSFVVVIDEAQNLSESSLEVVRTLTNFETARSKLVQVVLAGQPQFADKLMRPSLEQLRQRITTFCRIEPLTMEQRIAYIEHRVRFVGYSGPPLFTPEALNRIAETSEGIPRVINNLCWNALSLCAAMKRKQVDAAIVSEILTDLLIAKPAEVKPVAASALPVAEMAPLSSEDKTGFATPWMAVAAAILIAVILGVAALTYFGRQTSQEQAGRNTNRGNVSAPVSLADAPASDTQPVAGDHAIAIAVKVKRNESIRDLALQYLGEFNRKRVQQIMKLNPGLTDPNVILEGQTILLPARE